MTIDSYAPCPCGSGKKLKFCKCVEQPQDLETIMRLAEGGQELAALDRINQLLAKTPNTAWLLAIKAELALGMQEYATFRETALRFLKLKPDNPLALVMRSFVACNDKEPLDNAARYLLQGLSESRETLPVLTVPAINFLVHSLASTGKIAMAGFWFELLSGLTKNAEEAEQSMFRDPSLNLLAKTASRVLEDPPNAPWKERLAEVSSLVRTFRFTQAETKLRAILRDFPDQPGPLSLLLRAQHAQLDQENAFATAKKLSENPQLKPEDRDFYLAVAFEIEPNQRSISTPLEVRYCEVDSDERVQAALDGLDLVKRMQGQEEEQLRHFYAASVNDEVPAKQVYAIYDKPFSAQAPSSPPSDLANSSIAQLLGTVATFGKQTDRPARVLLIGRHLPDQQPQIERVLDVLSLGADVPYGELPTDSPYIEMLRRPKVLVDDPGSPLSIEQTARQLVDDFLNCPIAALDYQTPLSVAQDERKRGILRALLLHLEGEQSLVVERSAINEIYSRLELARPTIAVDPQQNSLSLVTMVDLDRLDYSQLSDGQLQAVTARAIGFGAQRVYYQCSVEILKRPSLQESSLRLAAISGMMTFDPTLEGKLKYCIEMQEAAEKANEPVGRIVLQRVGLLQAAGRSEESQKCLLDAMAIHPDDPYLLSFVQYMMEQSGRKSPASDPLVDLMESRQASSGLVLPGQSDPQETKSKLWLPGS
jgi:hypothetical protein